mmetsp:Transcript_12447/g.43317  ORF Transcript_12447/g.43317 Transcript_12447/m.43317 type:complete len:220 (-) Transcript_12447:236-895(-)
MVVGEAELGPEGLEHERADDATAEEAEEDLSVEPVPEEPRAILTFLQQHVALLPSCLYPPGPQLLLPEYPQTLSQALALEDVIQAQHRSELGGGVGGASRHAEALQGAGGQASVRERRRTSQGRAGKTRRFLLLPPLLALSFFASRQLVAVCLSVCLAAGTSCNFSHCPGERTHRIEQDEARTRIFASISSISCSESYLFAQETISPPLHMPAHVSRLS